MLYRTLTTTARPITLTDLPDEVLAQVFGAILRAPPSDNGLFASRTRSSTIGATDALALAATSRRLWKAFGRCLVRIYITTARLPPVSIRTLIRASGAELRQLWLCDFLEPSLGSFEISGQLLSAIAVHCTRLEDLRFSAKSLRITPAARGISREFVTVCERVRKLAAYDCSTQDMWSVCAADYTRNLCALALTVENAYECDEQLSRIWKNVDARKLVSLELGICPNTLGRRSRNSGSLHEVVGDGLRNMRELRELSNLRLNHISIERLPIRALVEAHYLAVQVPINECLRSIQLKSVHVWPQFITKLAEIPRLRDIRIEKCRIDAPDVEVIVRKAGPRLTSFWGNLQHWLSTEQIQAINECPNLFKLDLYCKYERACGDIKQYCHLFGSQLKEIRLGGPDITCDDILEILDLLPAVRRVNICEVPLDLDTVQSIVQKVGVTMESLMFDNAAGGWHAIDLFELVMRKTKDIEELSFPLKMRENIPTPQSITLRHEQRTYRAICCEEILAKMETVMHNLDIETIRDSILVRDAI